MSKTILVTGATDGIGLETARKLLSQNHTVLLHGRDPKKLERVAHELKAAGDGKLECYLADLSNLSEVEQLAKGIATNHSRIDVLINNAGVYGASAAKQQDDLDVRFVVNTLSPYLLTLRLLSILGKTGRVVNLSSAAQAPVDLEALTGRRVMHDGEAYAQSKLALTMWSCHLGHKLKDEGPMIIAVNPRSMLGSKMVMQAYGVSGGDLRIGADILCRAALSDEFREASGKYFDNDIGRFSAPHPDALNPQKCEKIIDIIEALLGRILN